MKIDKDIENLLVNVESGRHSILEAAERFLESLPGFNNNFHLPLTVKTYRQCLLQDPYNFKDFMAKEGINFLDGIKKDMLIFYQEF